MLNTTCHDAFDAAQKRRTRYPLQSGRYKLGDAQNSISRMLDTTDAIADCLNRPSSYSTGQTLGHCCTTDDKAIWLKNVPTQIADMLGHNILPAIAALTGDGVTKAEAQRRLSRANLDARRLIADCEAVRLRLKAGIGREYSAMKQGQSHLRELLTRALTIAKSNPA